MKTNEEVLKDKILVSQFAIRVLSGLIDKLERGIIVYNDAIKSHKRQIIEFRKELSTMKKKVKK